MGKMSKTWLMGMPDAVPLGESRNAHDSATSRWEGLCTVMVVDLVVSFRMVPKSMMSESSWMLGKCISPTNGTVSLLGWSA